METVTQPFPLAFALFHQYRTRRLKFGAGLQQPFNIPGINKSHSLLNVRVPRPPTSTGSLARSLPLQQVVDANETIILSFV